MAYRLKHIPTGLYFCPSRSIRLKETWTSVKSNLSRKGKAYISKPSLKWTEHIYNETGELIRTSPDDWLLETC